MSDNGNKKYLKGGSVDWDLLFGQPAFSMHSHCKAHLNAGLSTVCLSAKSLQLCPTLCDAMECSLPGSSVHGLFQARIPERVAISFSRGFFRPWDQTPSLVLAGRFFTTASLGKSCNKTDIEGKFGHRVMHTERVSGEDWSYAAPSQGTTKSWDGVWNRSFSSAFRWNMALLTT